jgi:hypothetical protein
MSNADVTVVFYRGLHPRITTLARHGGHAEATVIF